MFVPSVVAVTLAAVVVPAAAQSSALQSLYDALDKNGASNFAAAIKSNADLVSLYSSGVVKTVFAPYDDASVPSDILRRALSNAQIQIQSGLSQFRQGQSSINDNGGSVFPTAYQSTKISDGQQNVIADTRPANSTVITKRHLQQGGLFAGSSVRRNYTTPLPSLLRIDSGLGAVSNIIKADIPFDGGLIQIVDSYFTIPVSLSSTASQTGQTTFNSLASSKNLTTSLNNAENVTVFLPSNEAFSAAGINGSSSATTSQLLSNHVVSGFVGYLPTLTDGLTLKTQNGEVLTVSVRDNIWYINDARISQANLVLDSGVAHVIDKVLTPKPAVVTSLAVTTSKAGWTPFMCATLALLALLF